MRSPLTCIVLAALLALLLCVPAHSADQTTAPSATAAADTKPTPPPTEAPAAKPAKKEKAPKSAPKPTEPKPVPHAPTPSDVLSQAPATAHAEEAVAAPRENFILAVLDSVLDSFGGFGASLSRQQQRLIVGTLLLTPLLLLLSRALTGSVNPLRKGNSILLLGNQDSGKTVLFYKLRDNEVRETVPSMKPNAEAFSVGGADAPKYTYVDFPGHGSRRLGLSEYMADARGIIFVVDSCSVQDQALAAEYLYDVLTTSVVTSRRLPVLVACSKSDLPNAQSPAAVEQVLLKHLDNKRNLQHSMADIGGETLDKKQGLGTSGKPFTFDQHPCRVSLVSFSSYNNVQPITDFVGSL